MQVAPFGEVIESITSVHQIRQCRLEEMPVRQIALWETAKAVYWHAEYEVAEAFQRQGAGPPITILRTNGQKKIMSLICLCGSTTWFFFACSFSQTEIGEINC